MSRRIVNVLLALCGCLLAAVLATLSLAARQTGLPISLGFVDGPTRLYQNASFSGIVLKDPGRK